MTRKIISQLIIILITLFTAMSIFWFLKTSAVKKQALALISASDGKASAVSVSVSGFPFKQKLVIEDLKFRLATNLPQNPLILSANKYQITIKRLEAASSILSGNFTVNNIADVSIQDENGVTRALQLNIPPQASFSIIGGELIRLSYQDSGYKILDEGKNILFENGSSSINFESAIIDNKYHNKVRVEFKDVGMFFSVSNNLVPATKENLPDVAASDTTPNPVASENTSPTTKSLDTNKSSNNAQPNVAVDTNNVAKSTQPMDTTSNVSVAKQSFVIDLEYIINKSSLLPAEVPAPDTKEPQVAEAIAPYKSRLESLTIKDFEISSPLYKVNINGEVSSFPQDGFPIANISARIEKFDNLLIILKSSIAMLTESIAKSHNIQQNTQALNVANVTASTTNIATPPTSLANVPPVAQNNDQKPTINIEAIIRDISKKNPATNTTNDGVAVFDFRQELGKDLLINEVPLTEIMGQALPSVNNHPLNYSANGASIPSVTNPVAQVPTQKMTAPAPVKTPSIKTEVPKTPKPNNAN